jgi:hypothetical protein
VREAYVAVNKLSALDENHGDVCHRITSIIMANEEPESWKELEIINGYIKNPLDKNTSRVEQVQEIALEHQVDDYLASILYASKR